MRRFLDFILNMEGRRWRALLATALLLAAVTGLFLVGKHQLELGAEGQLEAWMSGFRTGPWGVFVAILVFTAAAFLGLPQFLLIAACVVA
ncbi:MAG: TVP38/TMEM64 family protein, partial [Brevundimonas sp.]